MFSSIQRVVVRLVCDRILSSRNISRSFRLSDALCYKPYHNVFLQHCLSTGSVHEKLCWGGSSKSILLEKLECALKDHRVDEAWDTYKDFKRLYGFPNHELVSRLITEMSYSSDAKWIRKASNIVVSISEEKSDLLGPELLIKLALSLARGQMPVLASKVLRLMLDKKNLPPVDMLKLVFLHLVKTETGVVLASNILIEICDCFQQLDANKSNCVKSRKPDTMIFNLVLDGCVRFRSSFKGQQIIELMAEVGVIADAQTIVIIAQVHEMNGMRDELKKFKGHIDQVSAAFASYYRQFYDSLLSLHFSFNDIDAASALILDLYKCRASYPPQETRREPQKPYPVSIGSHHLREGLRLQVLPSIRQKDSIFKVESKQELIIYKDGTLVLSNKALAKLIVGYRRNGRITKLSKLLVQMHKESDKSEYNDVCTDIVNACIHLEWFETAHDILDDFKFIGKPLGPNLYKSLLTAYYDKKMFKEAETLSKQLREAGLVLSINSEMVDSECWELLDDKGITNSQKLPSDGESQHLAETIIREMREEEKFSPEANELNSSIYFFMKAKMTDDAMVTYRKMKDMKIRPTVATFIYLVSGCSSLKMYREVTILWGDIKRLMEHGNVRINRDLCELLLLNFLRGGYFERVIEVMSLMETNRLYLDKLMYKREYLKFHKDLYRKLKASDARNKSQGQRIEHVQAFREWVGIC